MKINRTVGVSLALALAACGAPSTPSGPGEHNGTTTRFQDITGEPSLPEDVPHDSQAYPEHNPFRLLALEELPIVAVTVDSHSDALPKERLIDGDLSTQWVNGGYRHATSWAAVQLAAPAALASVGIKTGPSAIGTRYDVQVSSDGTTWKTMLANQTNTTWGLELKALPANTSGQYVRIYWHNSAGQPQAHVAIYELQVNGVPGSRPDAAPMPAPPSSETPAPRPAPGATYQRVMPTSVTAASSYTGLSPQRVLDGDLATQWVNDGYKQPEAGLIFAFAASHRFGRVRVRTGALPEGITFKVDVSPDGVNWEPASGRLKNTTWNMEAKDVFGTGKFLRIRFFNSNTAPMARFSLYEFEAYETTGVTPPITPPSNSTPMPAPTGSTDPYAQWYPDWLSIPPRDVFMDGTASNRRLRFDTALANIGVGHVQIRNRVEGDTGIAVQDILDGDNRVVYSKEVSRFVYEVTHGHNHVDDIARYELREGSPNGRVIRTASKVSFCVEDSFKYYQGTAETARYSDCKPEMMGITRGYADLYSANLPGQEFNITGLPEGEYFMVIHVDPYKKFMDSSRANNIAWTRIYLAPEDGTFEILGNSP
jgi:hypothetical protein